jgi:hypothetical protein
MSTRRHSWSDYSLQMSIKDSFMVPMAGLEPARLAPLPPQDSVSTNSTTSANLMNYVDARNLLILRYEPEPFVRD